MKRFPLFCGFSVVEIVIFDIVSKTFLMKRIYCNEAFREMKGNVLTGFYFPMS